jgi:6-phosphofructokinase 1
MAEEGNWSIESLGECTIASTLPVLEFVTDSSETPTWASLEKAGPRSKLFFKGPNVTAGIVTCGGICPALNDVIRSIVNMLHYKYGVKRILGFKYGFAGLNPASSVRVLPCWR